jgi:uncharacterized protein YjhX (UPF0386 family)
MTLRHKKSINAYCIDVFFILNMDINIFRRLVMEKAKSIQNKNYKITDSFWSEKIALIKNEVIPYQWRAPER